MGFKYSFVMPAYNAEKYIESSIQSIINQKYEKWELIIVNDGSRDNTRDIVEKICILNPKIRLINKENGGQLSARLRGVDEATGNYICFVDSDDLISASYLQIIDAFLSENKVDVLSFNWNKVNENGIEISTKNKSVFKTNGIVDKYKYIEKIITTSNLNALWSKVFSVHLFKNCVYKDEDFCSRHGEDLVQTLKLINNSNSFAYIDDALYLYRQNDLSVSNTFNKKAHISLESTRPALLQFLIEHNFNTSKNLKKYYRMYIDLIVRQLFSLSVNLESNKEIVDEFEIIQKYHYVCDAKKHIGDAGIIKRHLLLKFYNRNYQDLICKFKSIQKVRSLFKSSRH